MKQPSLALVQRFTIRPPGMESGRGVGGGYGGGTATKRPFMSSAVEHITFSAPSRNILSLKKTNADTQRLKIREFGEQSKDATKSLFFPSPQCTECLSSQGNAALCAPERCRETCKSLSDRKETHAVGDLEKNK